jgi:hypothetical protein
VGRAASLIQTGGIGESVWLRDVLGRADFPHGFTQWHVPLASANSLQRAVNAFAVREMEKTLRPLSLWWSDGSDGVAPSWLCARGLPAPKGFSAMLSGRWEGPDWRSVAPDDARWSRESREEDSGPALRITASHEPVTREWGAAPTTAHFVLRPGIGLWGVTATQAVADVLHGVEDSGSLTVIAERVRAALEAVQRQLANSTDDGSQAQTKSIGTIVFVAHDTDCALIFSGPAQAIRCRGSRAVAVVGIADDWDDDDPVTSREPRVLEPANIEVDLIDLITGRAVAVDSSEMSKALDAVRTECGTGAAPPLPVVLLVVAQE